MCFIDSVELDELYQPIIVYDRRILSDTEGAGRHLGAPSLQVEFGPNGCEIDVSYVSDGRLNPPRGVHGGGTGGGSDQFRRRVDGSTEQLEAAATVRLAEGESIISVCCGGGGYGRPSERDPVRVLQDVRDGWVSADRARDVYKVVFDSAGEVDAAKTGEARRTAA